MRIPCYGHAAGGRKGPGRWVVQLRVRGEVDSIVVPASDEHLPIRQHRRRLQISRHSQATGGRESPGHRVVQFREEWSYLVLFLWLALVGAGQLSLDHLISWFRKRQTAPLNHPKPLLRPQG